MGVLYFCFDQAGDLIYIGQTWNWNRRVAVHKIQTPWWPEVSRVAFANAPDETPRKQLEAALIFQLCPRHNFDHSSRPISAMERQAAAELRRAYKQAKSQPRGWRTGFCSAGHELATVGSYAVKGGRRCAECQRQRVREYRARKRLAGAA